ncbi:unnamed protein product [Prunus armeniaca]
MGILSSILGFCDFGVGTSIGLVIGYYLFIYFQPTDVMVGSIFLSCSPISFFFIDNSALCDGIYLAGRGGSGCLEKFLVGEEARGGRGTERVVVVVNNISSLFLNTGPPTTIAIILTNFNGGIVLKQNR